MHGLLGLKGLKHGVCLDCVLEVLYRACIPPKQLSKIRPLVSHRVAN